MLIQVYTINFRDYQAQVRVVKVRDTVLYQADRVAKIMNYMNHKVNTSLVFNININPQILGTINRELTERKFTPEFERNNWVCADYIRVKIRKHLSGDSMREDKEALLWAIAKIEERCQPETSVIVIPEDLEFFHKPKGTNEPSNDTRKHKRNRRPSANGATNHANRNAYRAGKVAR